VAARAAAIRSPPRPPPRLEPPRAAGVAPHARRPPCHADRRNRTKHSPASSPWRTPRFRARAAFGNERRGAPESRPTRPSALAGSEQPRTRVAVLLARGSERVVAPLELSAVGCPERAQANDDEARLSAAMRESQDSRSAARASPGQRWPTRGLEPGTPRFSGVGWKRSNCGEIPAQRPGSDRAEKAWDIRSLRSFPQVWAPAST
jgi:hypothetical protein